MGIELINKPHIRWGIDTALIIAAVAGIFGYGISKAEQDRLIQDVKRLEHSRDTVIELKSKFESFEKSNNASLARIELMLRSNYPRAVGSAPPVPSSPGRRQ